MDKIHYKNKNNYIYFKNGLHEGLAISPGLFDIYLENFIIRAQKILSKINKCNFYYLAYADDLV